MTNTYMTLHNASSPFSGPPSDAHNASIPGECLEFRSSAREYLPWNNSDTIVSKEVVDYIGRVRNNAFNVLFLIGGPANVINMAVFVRQGLGDRVNLLLFSLSLADEVFLTASMLMYAEQFYQQFTGHKGMALQVWMKNHHFIGFMGFCFVSFVLSAVIACERCCCVFQPLKYASLMRTRTLAVIIVALFVTVPALFFVVAFRTYLGCVYDPDTGRVSVMYIDSEFYRRHQDFVNNLDVIFGAGLPTVAVIAVVTATVMTSYKLRQAVTWRAETAATSSALSAREVALTRMLIGTSVLFIVCVSPSILRRLASLVLPHMNTGGRHENLYVACSRISSTLVFLNSSLNFFVYYRMGSRYRDTFWTLFRRKTKGRRSTSASQ